MGGIKMFNIDDMIQDAAESIEAHQQQIKILEESIQWLSKRIKLYEDYSKSLTTDDVFLKEYLSKRIQKWKGMLEKENAELGDKKKAIEFFKKATEALAKKKATG